MAGVIAFGAYVPRLRLQRSVVVAANAWFNSGLNALRAGERSMCGWDEDVVTMAVEAARDCLADFDRNTLSKVVLASTTAPFADRQNAGIVKEALNLPDDVGAMDVGGSQRAGASALIDAFQAAAGGGGPILCLAAEKRHAAPASTQELTTGDAAGAILVGPQDGLAKLLASHSVTVDFVDHFRAAQGQDTDYEWEARWVREEGYAKLTPPAVAAALKKANIAPDKVDRFIMPSPMKGVDAAVARACGVRAEAVQNNLADVMGDAGPAQALIMLAHALESAKVGDIIVVVGFGSGCDVLVLAVTAEAPASAARMGVSGWLVRRKPETNYVKYLSFNGHIQLDLGMRAEFDQKTFMPALYRGRRAILALVGGRCPKTGSVQFPKSLIGVAQNERVTGPQEDYPLADRLARIVTHTADSLTFWPDPPNYYGALDFEEGGRLTTSFADLEPEDIFVGAPMRMMFRIQALDGLRHFTKYFWKAVPDYRAQTTKAA